MLFDLLRRFKLATGATKAEMTNFHRVAHSLTGVFVYMPARRPDKKDKGRMPLMSPKSIQDDLLTIKDCKMGAVLW